MPINIEEVELTRLILNVACGATDSAGAVIRSLELLTLGNATDFCEYTDPPQEISEWLAHAEMESVRGLLMSTLHRWHELQRKTTEPPSRASRRVSSD